MSKQEEPVLLRGAYSECWGIGGEWWEVEEKCEKEEWGGEDGKEDDEKPFPELTLCL